MTMSMSGIIEFTIFQYCGNIKATASAADPKNWIFDHPCAWVPLVTTGISNLYESSPMDPKNFCRALVEDL